MIRICSLKAFVFGASLMLFNSLCFAQDLANGKTIYLEVCASCHGQYGEVSNEVIPNILGQYPGYLLTQMAALLSDDPKQARQGVAGNQKR
jgi:cytochrome c553